MGNVVNVPAILLCLDFWEFLSRVAKKGGECLNQAHDLG